MKYILLALFAALVCSCDNYIPCVKEYNSDTKALSKKDSIINIDSTSHDFNYIINIPTK